MKTWCVIPHEEVDPGISQRSRRKRWDSCPCSSLEFAVLLLLFIKVARTAWGSIDLICINCFSTNERIDRGIIGIG